MLIEMNTCEVCNNQELESVLDLGLHPMCDDLVKESDTRICKTYPIEILYCSACNTAHQKYQIPKEDLFPQTYHYRARHTADVLKGMAELVDCTINVLNQDLTDLKVLDVGCNDGSLLSIFKGKGAKTYGIEPTGAYSDAKQNGHIVSNKFFTPEVATAFVEEHGQPDIVTFTNVFAHIENLPQVIQGLKILSAPHTTIVIENHYLGAVLDKFQFDTFYHEHPRTYSLTSFSHIAKSLGMNIIHAEFPKRYNGNIRVILSKVTSQSQGSEWKTILDSEKTFGIKLKKMATDLKDWKKTKRQEIEAAVQKHGRLVAKAFPGRAAIPLHLLQLSDLEIELILEKPGSGKIGHYAPGTRILICSDSDFVTMGYPAQKPILNLAWHIRTEIENYMKETLNFNGPLIDIINNK